jgi:asparagine synthase (glutamine-hydrolysing)
VSAICGAVGLDGRCYAGRDVQPMLAALAGLGPDGRGDWAGPAGDLGVAVGVVRRNRVPEDRADRQPVHGADGTVLVADVVLDNRADLAARLGEPDRLDVPDSRLVLAAYRRWGLDCLPRLGGDFAVAIVDPRRGGVLLARDHVGIRPLHVHIRAGTLAFASTALALSDFPGVGAELDVGRLAAYLAGVMATERSWVAGVQPVPPGAAVWIGSGGISRWRYWDLDRCEMATDVPAGGQVAALRDTFDRAVRARLRTTGGVGIALSGGLDSTSVAAAAAVARSPEPVHTYTSVPPADWLARQSSRPAGFEPDESPLVADLAGRYRNLRPRFVDAVGVPFLAGYEQLFELGGVPLRNPCNGTWLREICRLAAADGAGTLLTGARGNAFFSADDPGWLIALLRRGRLGLVAREVRSWAAASGRPVWRVLRRSVAGELAPAPVRRAYEALPWRHGPGLQAEVERWFAATALRAELRDHADVAGSVARAAAGPRAYAPVGLLGQAAGAELHAASDAWYGLNSADPTGDVRVIELCAAQPAWVRRGDGLSRAACRAAMAGRLPDSIRLRTARGLQLPDWLDRMTDARPELAAELRAAREYPLIRQVIDLDLLDAAMRDWPAASADPAGDAMFTYRSMLLRALLASRYMRWFSDRRRPTAVRPGTGEVRPGLHVE